MAKAKKGKWTLNNLSKFMFEKAGIDDEELRGSVCTFLLIYTNGGAKEAAAYLEAKPQAKKIFEQAVFALKR